MTTNTNNKKNILLIDNNCNYFPSILYYIDLNKSDFIVFNSNENTYNDVIEMIRNNNKKYESIGIFQNNSNESYYQFSKKENQCLLENDSSLTSWNEYINFLNLLKTEFLFINLDLIVCALYSLAKWKFVIDELETQLQIQISTSNNINQNGYWFFETNKGINLRDVYFINQQILEITPQISTTKKLLLIDNRIKDIELIINSMNDNTYCLVFNYFYDTLDTLLSKIRFLSGSNRYILDNFFYEEPQLPVRKDSEGNHCTTCEEFSIDDLVLSPTTLESEYLNDNSVWNINDNNNKLVFFQREKKIELNSSIIYRKRPFVNITDLDAIYQIAQTSNQVTNITFECIGIIQHTVQPYLGYKLVNSIEDIAVIENIQTTDSNLLSWSSFSSFIQNLKTLYQITTLDLMACALYANPDWKYIIDNLSIKDNITIRASNDNTGSSNYGGNWILETNDINLTNVYFTDKIYEWQYVLATYIDNRFYGLRFNDSMAATRGYDSRLKIAAGTNNFTIETWYYETAARYNCTIVDMGDYNYTFQIRNLNVGSPVGLSFTNRNYNGGSDWLYAESAVVPVAQWSHLAITRSGSTFTFYVNGVARQTFTNSASLFSNDSTFAIGWQSPDNCQCNRMKTDCVLYDIRLWNVARTAAEIQMNRNRVIPANSSGLVANYLCTDNSNTFNDRTSNALHTTIQNYDSARWTNSLVPIPNIGFLINNSYSLTTYNSTALNALTHFDNITNTDFSNINLSNVNFTNADLTGCNFTSANLSNANLNGANLTNANLTNATLDGTYLIGANLTGATTTGSTIASAITTTTLIKSNSSAFYLTPPTGASTTYGPTWSQLDSTIFGSNTDDALNVQSISKDSNIIAVSSPGNDSTGTDRGFVKIFKWSGSSWNQLGGTFYGISNNDLINNSKLSSDGNYVAFKYNDSAVSNKGFIGIFVYDSNKTVEDTNVNSASYGPIGWSRVGGFIYNEFAGDNNNVNIGLSGNGQIIAVGCEANDGTSGSSTDNRGSVRVYRYDPSKLTEVSDQANANFGPVGWTRMGVDIDGENAGDNFGSMIELSTDGTVLAGAAVNSDVNGTDNGQVRVFEWNTSSSTWVQRGRTIYGQLTVSWDTTYRFAAALSLSADGNIISCGNVNYASYAGITKTLQWNSTNNDYGIVGQQIKEFGDWQASACSVSLSSDGQILAVGAYNVARGFTGNGIIRIYKLTTSATTLVSSPPANMTGYSFSDTIYRMTITGNSSTGSVWGTNLYTADSNIAKAAVHAGVIANGETKEIYIKRERFQYKYFGSTRNGVTTNDFTDNSVTYVSYYFMDSPKLWVQIGNEIAGQGANYYIGGLVALSGNGTTLAVTGGWSNNIGLVQVYSLSSTDNYSHTSSTNSIAEVYGDIIIPKKAGFTTIASKQSSTITTSLLAITGTAPTFTSFPSVSKFTTDSQFTLTLPESNSIGAFTLTNGTIILTNGTVGTTVKYTRNALRFDGVNDAVVLNSYPTLDSTNQLTIEGWVFITNYSTTIICLNNNSDVGINSQGRIVFSYTIPFNWYYVISDTSVPLNTWVYIAIVKNDNGYNKIYINNNIVRNEADTVSGTFRTCVGISLASNAQGNSGYSSVILSELRIWSVARTEKQIRDNYNREVLSNSTGLQIYYKFNQGTAGGNNSGLTTLTDSTSNGYHGTITNFALSGTTSNYVTGVTMLSKDKYNITNETSNIVTINPDVSVNALNFNGTNNYIDLVSNITEMGQGNFTIECWIKTTGTRMGIVNCQDSDNPPVWEAGEKSFYLDSSGKPAFVGFGNNYILSTQAVDDNNWHHIAVVWSYSTNTGFIYIDGQDRTNKLNNFPYQAINNNTGRFIVGVPTNSESVNYFSGSMCELRIWSIAKTASQIYQNFRRVLNGDESGLVCYNRLNQGTANGANSGLTTATNNMLSGGYAGSLSGFSLVSNTSNWTDGITLRPNKDVTIVGPGVATITAIQEESGIYDMGTTTATVTVALKQFSSILTLDGVDDAVNIGIPAWTYSTQFRTTMTVECWFKTSDTNNQKTWTTLIGRNRSGGISLLSQFAVIMIPSGEIRFELTNTTNNQEVHTTTISYKDGLWHHVAVTYNSVNGEKKIYIDGSISRTDTVISGFGLMSSDTTRKLVFGSDSGALDEAFTDRQFRGSLSDIRIWSVVRTASEISNNYRQRLIGNESNLLGYWKLNQGYGSGWGSYTIALDSTSNRSHGTLTNFATASSNWTLSSLGFLPRISDITLGSKNGLYSLSDSSFTFIDPLSNSFGNFSYAINSAVATISNGSATTKTVYTTSGAITIPTLSLYDFPEIASLADWEINVSFTVTDGAGTWRTLLGDMYNEINSSNRGWGIWVSGTVPSKIHWSFVGNYLVNTFEPAQTLVSLNTPYILNVAKSSAGTITLTLQNVSGTYNNSLSISNLVASYSFDSNGNDSSSNNNTLTNVNTVTFNTSNYKRGSGSASFSGTNYFEIVNDGRFSPDNFTVACWVKPVDSSGNVQSIASCRDGFSFRGWMIYINPSNNLEFITGSGSGWSYGSDILLNGIGTINTWVHIAFTLSKSTNTIIAYINGTLQTTITRTYVNNTSYPLRIGAGADFTPAELFLRNGTLIDDFRFYNKVLSASEIGTLVADSSFSSVISIGSNIIGKGPVTIGGWRSNGGEIFTGTISNVNVKVPTNQRLVTLVSNTSGTPATITATQDSFIEFDTGTKTASLTIGNVTPTLSNFTIPAKDFGTSPFTLTPPTSNSLGTFTYTSSNTAVATISGSTVTIVGGGTSTIEATQASSGSYVSGTIVTTLTVNTIAPTLSNFTVAAKDFGTSPFTLTAPTTNSNGAFTYTSSNTNVATISGSTVTIVGVGSSTINATQASTTNYTTGTIVATLTVNQIAPTIGALTIPAKNYGDATFSLTAPTSNSSGAFTYTSSNTAVATIIPSNIFSINNPTLYSKLTNFPSISTLSDWEISISFVTTISGRYQALIGDRTGYNTNGWTFWLNPWGGVHITSYTEGIYWDYLNGTISANTNYIFTIKRTPLYLYIFIKNVSTGITVSSNTDYISAGKNLILTPDANVYVSLNSSSEGFVGTILAINVSNLNLSSINIVSVGTSTITATQASTTNYTSGSVTGSLVVNQIAPTLSNFTVPAKNYGASAFNLTPPTSSSTTTSSISSTASVIVAPSGINSLIYGNSWIQRGNDIDGEVGDESGGEISLSADGNVVAITAVFNDANGNESGCIRIYAWNGSTWIKRGVNINGEAADDYSGRCVSLSADGSIVAIGAFLNNGNGTDAGQVRVYVWNGTTWSQRGTDIDGENTGDQSGTSVKLSADGSVVAIGGPYNDGNGTDSGHVRIYEWNGSTWVKRGVDIDGEAINDLSGYSVGLSADGSVVAIGANYNDGNGTDAGHVRVYVWNGSIWTKRGADIDGEAVNDLSGWCISLSADGSIIAIGAPNNDGNGTDSGHVRVYAWNGSTWVKRGLDIDGEAVNDFSGRSVSLSADGSVVAIGAPFNDGNGNESGQIRIYVWNGSTWNQRGMDIDGEVANDRSGWSVSISADGSIVAIGAPRNSSVGYFSGHARIYKIPITNELSYSSSNSSVADIYGNLLLIKGINGSSTITASQTGNIINGRLDVFGTTYTFQYNSFTYTSSNTAVATISGSIVTIVGGGTTTITATQPATTNYTTGTITTLLVVNSIAPTIGTLTIPAKNFGDQPFLITEPISNSSGSFSYSSSNTAVAIVGNNSFATSSLLARYDASATSNYTLSGGNVTQWNDLTGNGYHLIPNGTGPTVSSIKSVSAFDFNSSRGFTVNSVPLNSEVTVFMVIKYSTNIATYGSFMHHGDRDFDWSIERDANSSNIHFQSNNVVNTLLNATNNVNYILVCRIVGNTRQFWRYSDTESTGSIIGTPVTIVTGNKTIYVGKSSIGEGCNSTIGEILYYNSSLSDANLNTTLVYLQNKWFNNITDKYITIIGAGTSTITATQASTTNYTSGNTTASLVVSSNAPTLSNFTVAAQNFGSAPFSLVNPTSNSGGAFTYTSSNTAVATISGSTVTIVGAGSSTITATQALTTNYTSGTITCSLVVSPIAPTLSTFTVTGKNYGDAAFTLASPTSNSSGAFTYTSSNTAVATISGSTVTVVGAGSSTITATQASTTNYTLGSVTGSLVVSPIAPTLSNFKFGNTYTNVLSSIAPGSAINDSAMSLNGMYQTITTFRDGIRVSNNYGASWTKLSPSPNAIGSALYRSITISSSGQYQSICEFNGYIYISNNYGVTWTQPTTISSPRTFESVRMSDNGQYQTCVADQDYIYTSSDYGQTWTQMTSIGVKSYYDIAMTSDGSIQYAVALNGGGILKSTDKWLTSTAVNTGLYQYKVGAIELSSNGQYISIVSYTDSGVNDPVILSNDGGTTWRYFDPDGNTKTGWTWASNGMSADGRIQILSYNTSSLNGGIYISKDYGITWVLDIFLNNIPSGVSISRDGSYMICGTNDLIIYHIFDRPKYFGQPTFTITAPTTNSNGAFTYTSSNTAVATISGTTVTILSVGTSTITATQASTSNYTSGTIVTTLTINSYENANLTGLDLSNNNLTGLNLSNSTLTNVTSGSIIGNPTLPTNYILINGYIIGPNVNLTNVNLSSQNLTNVNFTGVNLTGANLTLATLTGVISGSITGTPTLSASYSIINGYILGPSVNLSSKDLSNMNLLASNLTNVNLNSANIDNTDFSNTTLTGVKSGSVTGAPILPNNYSIIKGYIVGSNVDLTSATLTNINYTKVSYSAFDDFISGPTAQSTSNDWQYFEVNTDRSSSSLLSNWQNLTNSTNQVIPYGQWDNNRAFDSYPLVQKVADSGVIQCQYDASFTGPALIMCPDNSSTYNVGMGFKNTTGNTINVNIDLALSLVFPDRNTDGVNYFIQRGLINDARYKLYVNNSIPTASTNTFTFNKKNIELQNGEFIYLILNCVGVFFWDYIRVIFNVTVNNFKNLTLTNVNFTNANLSGTNLSGTTLTNSNISNTDFRTSILTNLISSGLTGTPLLSSNYNIVNNLIIGPNVNLTNVDLSNQNLTNINLSETTLTGANLTSATLTGVLSGSVTGTPTLSAAYTIINGYIIGPNVNLTNATLTSQNLTNKDLSGTTLTGANLTGATLTGVVSGSVTGTPTLSATYSMVNGYVVGPNVNLTNATLNSQNLTNKDLSGTNLTGTNLTNATLTGVVSGSTTGSPTLSAAYTMINGYVVGPSVNLTNATLSNQNLTNKDLSGTNLTGANLTGATLTGVLSGSVTGTPTLSAAYSIINGYVVGPNVNLTNATLNSQNLTNKDLSGANLTGANLTSATLTGVLSGSVTGTPTFSASYSMVNGYVVGPNVNLTNATLSNQNLSSKDLSGATLIGANLSGITVNTSTVFTNAVFTNVTTGNISGTTNNFPTNYNIIGGYVIGPSVNLVNATLSGANLSTKNLTDVDLTGANLSGANLSNVTINSNTNFTNSTLTNVSSGSLSGTTTTFPTNYNIIGGYVVGPSVNLSNATLSGLNLSSKILTGVNFTNANLTNAILTGSTIDNSTNITNATLTNVTTGSLIGTSTNFSSSYNLINGYVVGPSVNLTGANLSGQDLTNKDLSSANLTNVNLTTATLTGLKTGFITGTPTLSTNYTVVNNYILGPSVDLTNANLANQNLTNVNLSGANLSGTVLTDATLTGLVTSSITGAPTMNTAYTIINGYVVGPSVNLTNANLSGQDLTGKDLSNVNLSNANLSNATTTNIILSNTNINNADISNITFSNIQKAQLLKNTNNRSISNVQISNLSGTDILSLIPNSTISTINNISSTVFKVIPPSVENTIDLSLVTSGAFYVPSSSNESVIIDGKTYYSTSSAIINSSTGLATETLTFGTKIYKLFSGSIVGVELNLDTYKIYGVGFSNIFEAKGTLSSFSNSITAQQNLAVVGTSTLTGNVGINKSPSDTYKVDVLGTVRASLFTTTSDYRIKEDISNIEDNIDELKPVKYKNKLNNKMEYGFIAHEVQDFFPEIVEGDKDGEEYQSINYSGLIPILVNEIKKLKEEIKNLKK